MAHGGKRKGAGRKPLKDEIRVRELAVSAIVEVYGSELDGFKSLLNSGEPTLQKWVFETAYGKPQTSVDLTSNGETMTKFTVNVVNSPDES